jgi:hypothetical protein
MTVLSAQIQTLAINYPIHFSGLTEPIAGLSDFRGRLQLEYKDSRERRKTIRICFAAFASSRLCVEMTHYQKTTVSVIQPGQAEYQQQPENRPRSHADQHA